MQIFCNCYNYQLMKQQIFVVFFSLLVTIFSQVQLDPSYTYQDYEGRFNKNHEGLQRENHKNAFKKNFQKFKKAKKQNPSLEMNQFLDWTDEELKNFLNFKPEIPTGPKQSDRRLLQTTTFPSSYDYRALGKVTPIRDQGNCGSCWAFAAAGAYESQILLQNNISVDLAEQYPLDCDLNSYGCSGGLPRTALNLMNSTGAPYQTSFPYLQAQSTNNTLICGSNSGYLKLKNLATRIQFNYNLTDDQVIYELINYGPFPTGVSASDPNFMYAGSNGGVFNCAPGQPIDHTILLVGYNSTYWFVKNSWGPYWGNNGYAYINRSSDCGLKSYVVYFQTILYSNITPPPPPPPPAIVYITLRINMTDSRGDGWGWTIGFRQNGTIVANFTLTTGYSGYKTVSINSQLNTDVLVTKSGSSMVRSQIGFTIYDPNTGIIYYSRPSGTNFSSTAIFKTFCPTTCLASVQARLGASISSTSTTTDSTLSTTSPTNQVTLTKLEVGLITATTILSTAIIFIIGITLYLLKTKFDANKEINKVRKMSNDSISANNIPQPSSSIITGDV